VCPIGGLHESRTPHHLGQKAVLDHISLQENKVLLPKIHSVRGQDQISLISPPSNRLAPINSRRNENYDPAIYMSKELQSPKLNLIPKVDRYNNLNTHSALHDDLVNVSSIAASHDIVRGPIRQNYMQQKQILQ